MPVRNGANAGMKMRALQGSTLALSMLLLGSNVGAAPSTPEVETLLVPHLAIVSGTCDHLGETPTYQIGDASTITAGQDTSTTTPSPAAMPLLTVDQTVNASLDDLMNTDSPSAIVVTGDDPAKAPLACGEIAGFVDNGKLLIGLRPISDPGLAGIAWLDRDQTGILGLGPQEVQVTAYLLSETVRPAVA